MDETGKDSPVDFDLDDLDLDDLGDTAEKLEHPITPNKTPDKAPDKPKRKGRKAAHEVAAERLAAEAKKRSDKLGAVIPMPAPGTVRHNRYLQANVPGGHQVLLDTDLFDAEIAATYPWLTDICDRKKAGTEKKKESVDLDDEEREEIGSTR